MPIDKKIIVCVCRLVDGKQPYDVFKLAKLLNNQYFYVFIGGGDTDAVNKFRNAIESEGLFDRFRYINKIQNVEIHKYYKAADYVVNFNQHEIFGMALLEAMYQGTTVIARSAPGPEYLIEDGVSGYVKETLNEMASSILADHSVGNCARERVINSFNWVQTAQIILESYVTRHG